MDGDEGEVCDICKDEKDMLTYLSRVVLFHITGFYQWLVNSNGRVYWWLIKFSHYVPWKPHIENYIREYDKYSRHPRPYGESHRERNNQEKDTDVRIREEEDSLNKSRQVQRYAPEPNL